MLAFRSEGDAMAWAAARGLESAVAVGIGTLGELSRGWYGGRMSDDWRPLSPAAKKAEVRSAGLSGEFWELG